MRRRQTAVVFCKGVWINFLVKMLKGCFRLDRWIFVQGNRLLAKKKGAAAP